MSRYKNPVNDVGVTQVYGIDDPKLLENDRFAFVKEHTMTPQSFIDCMNTEHHEMRFDPEYFLTEGK